MIVSLDETGAGVGSSGMSVFGVSGEVAPLGPREGDARPLTIGDDMVTFLSGDEFRSSRLLDPEVHRRILLIIPPLLLDEDSPVRAELADS